MNAFYSTPSIYTEAKLQTPKTYSLSTYDQMPYAVRILTRSTICALGGGAHVDGTSRTSEGLLLTRILSDRFKPASSSSL